MSTHTTIPAAASPVRRAVRSAEESYIGGVAAGLARHLGLDPVVVRGFFVFTSVFGGFGLMLYAGLWIVMPLERQAPPSSPGLESATRQGRRPGRRARVTDAGPLVAMGALGLGVAVVGNNLLFGTTAFWPIMLAVLGVGVLWRQADEAQRERWLDSTGRVDLVRAVVGRGGLASWTRLGAGLALLVGALVVFAAQTGQARIALDVVLAGGLGVAGLALTLGPWLYRLTGELSEERAARVRQQERADVAAHLHDSVLQTLALIQKSAHDPAAVSRLARSQERDLRQWLYAEPTAAAGTVLGVLRTAAAEVEDAHGVPVELVAVGDAALTDRLQSLTLAAREAMVNAAKHSGAAQVDVYVEVAGPAVEVFVRDRGRGFDQDAVPGDRLGVRNSIVDRMRRHGGSATLRTGPGEGTEVHLRMTTEEEVAG